ncbi:MAG: hypothetical protein IJ313_01925 [Clostridia bacterium]|nr:hypothetical protein [Clostridia bacterium]
MNKRWMLKGAALCAMAMLAGGMAAAEEKRLGDYIYVPAMQVTPVSGAITLRVEGLALGAESDEPVVEETLAGAEFGVYVFSSSGELTPWANPLYPSEPMRIRSSEGETRFSLPQGAEYYLRQESAPQGYAFDDETLIPVTGEEIVVYNSMAGQLVVSAVDSLGMPVPGVQILLEGENGEEHVLMTDENGQAVLSSHKAQGYTIREGALPEGVFAARSVAGGEAGEQGAYARVEPAHRTRVTFEHPASGSVLLDMRLNVLGDNGQTSAQPLEGVRLDILSEPPVFVVTDEQGQARASVLEGTYDVRLSYEGSEDIVLPLSQGQMIVSSGSTTVIELSAAQAAGRIALKANAESLIAGGSFTLVSENDGREYGPFAMDAEGVAVSQPLAPGVYRVSGFDVEGGVQFGSISCGDETASRIGDLALTVQSGTLTQADVNLLTREKQMFGIVAEAIDENGALIQNAMGEAIALTLVDSQGQDVAQLESLLGIVTVEALSGEYRLRMSDQDAQRLGVQTVSAPLNLPSEQDTIRFPAEQTRLLLSAVNERGDIAAGAAYQITDSVGARHEVICDEDGMAVTPLLAPGEVQIETLDAPAGHAAAQAMTVQAAAGEAAHVQILHETLGVAALHVSVKSLDENGGDVYAPVQGTSVRLQRVDGDGKLTVTGDLLVTDDAGMAYVSLAAGDYAADVSEQALSQGMTGAKTVYFSVRNTEQTDAQLVCLDALGGVRASLTGGELTDEELAQVRFEIVDADGSVTQLHIHEDAFYVGGLVAGEYILRQTQIPQGYTLCGEYRVTVTGGEAALVAVPLEEYAELNVFKTGLTFDQHLRTYVVPLSGEYGVYVMEGGELRPYPGEENQATLWANVTMEEIAAGKAGSVKLPATVQGTTYYLHELTRAPGFAADENYYEVTLRAGEKTTLNCAVSSDRGFFTFDAVDTVTGAHVPGGAFELVDTLSGEVVHAFELGEMPYQNPMAVPVGTYILRQTKAAPGYALSVPAELSVVVEPYLSEGGTVADVQMAATAVPESGEMDLFREIYTASEQGLSLLCVDTDAAAQALHAPALTIEVGAAGSERSDIASIVIAGTGDALGGAYRARVEYCLDGGGWQPSDARMTDVLMGPTAVSLNDVHDDISAVRITYIDAVTGEEYVQRGFTPGQVSLNIEASAEGSVNMVAQASFSGLMIYQTELGGEKQYMERSAQAQLPFTLQAAGLFDTVSPGRDGRISGVAFFDEDADGVMDASETGRYAGLNVSLLTVSGEVIDAVRTGADGSYAFDAISGGEYMVQFDAGESVVFSSGDVYSAHRISSIDDMRYGTSGALVIDGDHTDYVVHVGCIFGSEVLGSVIERVEGEQQAGFGGLTIEMRAADADEDDEPLVVVTGGMGEFAFSRLLPGEYEISLEIPQGYLCREAEEGRIVTRVSLVSGESYAFDTVLLEKAAQIQGTVRVDEDGDGVIDEGADTLAGVRVALLAVHGAHTERIAQTTTDEYGKYAFEQLYSGDYSVLFELHGEWAFTRFGGDSDVYGAVSQSGATRAFTLEPGGVMQDVDAGVTMPARLTVAVFQDTQYDGQKGVYEKMLSGAQIALIRRENGQDAEEVAYVTGENGTVVFEGVSPGEYVLAYELPGQWRATKQVTSENYPVSCVPPSSISVGRSEPFTLDMSNPDEKLYIGAMLSGSISGSIYYDDDDDAKRDEGETPCADVLVELISGEQVTASVAPAANGGYLFEGLAPGRYTVRFTAQEGCGFSGTERTAARGGVLESDSHVSSTKPITVTGGQTTSGADAGVVRLSSIAGVIWEDQSGDQIMDGAERAMGGLSVHLMDGAGRNILHTAQTDDAGRFVFDHLKPATYKIRVDAPQGYVFSGAMAGSPLTLETERDGRGYSAPFALLGGVHVDSIGFGLLTQGTIGGFVWEDADFDGRMDGGEPGLRGVTVTLLDGAGQEVASRQTVRSGEFTFDQLMPGDYAIRVTLMEGYAFTAAGGESAAPQGMTGSADIPVGPLKMGGTIADVRVGALKTSTVGGVIWLDQDDDGRRQTNDQGMYGVRAMLTVLDGADAGKTYETAADETGSYRFDGVMPGQAEITFEIPQGYAFARRVSGTRRVSSVDKLDALTATTDAFNVVSGENQMDMDVGVVGVGTISGVVWEDAQYDGSMSKDESGVSGALIELVDIVSNQTVGQATTDESGAYAIGFARRGEYRVRVTLPDGRIFTRSGESAIEDVDACDALTAAFTLAMGESVERLHIGAIAPAVVRGRMVVDENEDGVCGEDEAGLEGAVVTAMQGGTVVATAYTDETGRFVFDTLRPGTHRLRYVLSDETLFARGIALNMTDADALEAETGEYTLEMGQRMDVGDVAVVRAARIAGSAWMDENVNGTRDAQESALTGVTAQLLGEGGQVLMETQVASDGSYAFERLRSGTYAIRFALPQNVLFTDYTGNPGDSCIPVMQGSTGETNLLALTMGEEKADMHVGGILPGRIGDTVWYDKDGNGLQDYKEPLIPGVSLTLLYVHADGTMTETATVSSDQYGYYAFEALRPGTYVLRVNAQAGDSLTSCFGEPLGEIDSDVDPDTYLSAPIALRSGQTLRNIDVGLRSMLIKDSL